jgi:outer membrane protein insertion porin family
MAMCMMKKLIYVIILLLQITAVSWAQGFVIRHIDFEGLQRVSPVTVESYLPVKPGDTILPEQSAEILRVLYKTGFFDNITIAKKNHTLIIRLVERPTIGQLKIVGNSVIPTDKLTNVMKTMDIAEGRVYNPAILDKIKQSLLNQYYQLGRYNAHVDVQVTNMTRNRVFVKIDISEGLIAKIQKISIIGNHVFDESILVKQLDLSAAGLFSFITQSDSYSEEKLEASLEKIRAYYLDHGYIRFEIKSAQASVTPDRKSVYITLTVEEGQPYTIKDFQLTGDLILSREDLLKQINIKRGDVFSRQKVLEAEKAITKLLGDKGYMFATISLRPEINDETKELILVFDIKPGKRTYIRHIMFSDNNRTNDEVLRREIIQMESAPASTSQLEESKHRLLLLPYIKDVDMTVRPTPDTDNQVDVNYKVKEDNTAQASFKVGYSQVYRTIFGAGLNQKNFFGTGNTLGINFQRSKFEQVYGIDYTNPYYTADGISRSFNFMISRVDPGAASNLNNGYTANEYDLGVLYGIPVGQEYGVFNRAQVGFGYQNILINPNTSNPGTISNQVQTFLNDHGRRFQELDIKLGFTRDSRDKAIFPTVGGFHTLFLDAYVPVSGKSISFYTLNYHAKWYKPLINQFIFTSKADFGYGNGFHGAHDFPFFKNFYAGGIDSVRGYQGYTLGPRDSNDKSFGGNILADLSIGLIFPNYLSDNLRTSMFIDAGNVYSIVNNRNFGGQSTNSGPIRLSIGIEADLITPFGPIELSLAQPLNRHKHDDRETFQFALGANF